MNPNASDDFKKRVYRIAKVSIVILILFIVGFAVVRPFSAIFLGLALGTSVSLINVVLTAIRINKIGENAVSNHSGHARPVFAGMFTRFSTSILAILLALEFPQYLSLFSTLFGLFIVQIITVVDGIKHKY